MASDKHHDLLTLPLQKRPSRTSGAEYSRVPGVKPLLLLCIPACTSSLNISTCKSHRLPPDTLQMICQQTTTQQMMCIRFVILKF